MAAAAGPGSSAGSGTSAFRTELPRIHLTAAAGPADRCTACRRIPGTASGHGSAVSRYTASRFLLHLHLLSLHLLSLHLLHLHLLQVRSGSCLHEPAACLHSGQDEETYRALVQQALGGAFRILYAAPERLETESFTALCQRLDVRLVAVDEAHCVSQWGQDFRPSYLKIAAFLARLPRRPAVGAFTATATEQVKVL